MLDFIGAIDRYLRKLGDLEADYRWHLDYRWENAGDLEGIITEALYDQMLSGEITSLPITSNRILGHLK